MPSAVVMLSNINQSVLRPSVLGIVEQLKEMTGIGSEVEIYYPGIDTPVASPGSTIDSDVNRLPRFSTKRRVMIEVEEDHDPSELLSTAVSRYEHLPIWSDEKLGVFISPIYSKCDVSINYRFITNSKEEAVRWRNDIRTRVSMGREYLLHEINYHYILHRAAIQLIADIYINRENVEGYGESLETYLLSHGTPRLRLVGASDGQEARLAVAEKQARIIGHFDFEGLPEQISKEDGGAYSISFTYRFSFNKPIAVNLKYPIIVHNELLPKEYITFQNSQFDPASQEKEFSKSQHYLWGFENDNLLESRIGGRYMVRLPMYDDFIIRQNIPKTVTAMIVLCTVEDDKRTLVNLNDLREAYISPSILKFIKESELPFIARPFASVLGLSLYRDKYLSGPDSLIVDEDLMVKSDHDLNLRRQHRVRLHIVTDWTMLDKDAIDRLVKYPDAFEEIIRGMDDLIRNDPDGHDYGEKNSPIIKDVVDYINRKQPLPLEEKELEDVVNGKGNKLVDWPVDKYDSTKKEHLNAIQHNTVMKMGIIARRRA